MLQACHPGGKLGGIGLDLGAAGIVHLNPGRGFPALELVAARGDALEPVNGLQYWRVVYEGLAVDADDLAVLHDDVLTAQDFPGGLLEGVELGHLGGDGEVPLCV